MSHPDPRWCARIRSQPRTDLRSVSAEGPSAPRTEPRVVDRADFDPDYDPRRPIECECCGSTMFYTAACKIQCPNCGYKRDCSDP